MGSRNPSIRTVTTLYFDGRYWCALVERHGDGAASRARYIFGAEPSNPEILRFTDSILPFLRFYDCGEGEPDRKIDRTASPKRRQREAAKALRNSPPGTSLQRLNEAREAEWRRGAAARRQERERSGREEWERRRRKRKQARKGK